MAVSINLRSNCYSVMVNIINNIDVDILFLLIQTSDVQFIECVQLYLRQCHHLPIQYRNILALLWAARLIWCWRLWIIWFNNQLTCSLDVYIASVVLWQVLFQALDELLHLLNWEIFLATIIQLLHILIGDILFALLQQCYHTTCVWQIFLIFLENILCIYVWNIVAIFLNQSDSILKRNILFLGFKNLFQLINRKIFLVIVCKILETCYGKMISVCFEQQVYLTKWNKLGILISLKYLNNLIINLIGS